MVNDTDVICHYEYDVWGNLTVCEETVENRFKYNGQQFDPISQQYYLRARYYNPIISRFTQEDTYRGDGLNLYAYCRNNPIVYIDPSGNICETAANRIREKVTNNTSTKNEQRKLAAYERNEARKRGEAPSEYYTDYNGSWHRPNGEYAKNVEVGRQKNNASSSPEKGGRLGNESTRKQNEAIADYLESRGFKIIGGGGKRREEYLPAMNEGNKGSKGGNYVDVTVKKGDVKLRINTVDTYADGKTPTTREQIAANLINKKLKVGEMPIILIPKGVGLGDLPNIINKLL